MNLGMLRLSLEHGSLGESVGIEYLSFKDQFFLASIL